MLDDFGEGSRKQGFIADSMLSGSRSNSMIVCNSLEGMETYLHSALVTHPANPLLLKAMVWKYQGEESLY